MRNTDAHALHLLAAVRELELWVEEDRDVASAQPPHRYAIAVGDLKVRARPARLCALGGH